MPSSRSFQGVRSSLVCLFVAVVSSPVLASVSGEWVRVETESFTLVSDAGQDHAVAVGASVERLRDVLTQLSGARLDSPAPTTIYLFRDHASYEPYRLYRAGRPVEAIGYLVPHEHGYYAALNGDPDLDPARFVYKQYVLHLLHHHIPNLPAWFSQGVAEYFSTFEADDVEARIGLPIAEYVHRLRRRPRVAVGDLFRARAVPVTTGPATSPTYLPSLEGATDFYVSSWALVHYLLVGSPDTGRERVRAYLGAIRRGAPPDVAWAAHMAIDRATLGERLQAYVSQERFRYLRVSVRSRAEIAATAFPMVEHEVLFRLGDLVLHTAPSRRSVAVEHFQRALALAPEHGPAQAGLGWAAELSGEFEAARTHYALAVEQGPDEPLSQFLYGESLLRTLGSQRPENEDGLAVLEKAREAFRRCVELREDYGEAWARLGFADGLAPRPSQEGVAALETSLRLLPGRTDVALNLLLAYARSGDGEKARALNRRLEALGAEPAVLDQAREILLRLELREANQLVRRDRLDEAIALYAHVRAMTRDPALREQATEYLETMGRAQRHNAFVAPYNEIVLHLGNRDVERAAAVLEELEKAAKPGRQAEAVATLRDWLESLRTEAEE